MADELLIRVYDVGLGDCIYVRIPGAVQAGRARRDFHMLIDCGSWSGMEHLERALENLAEILPETSSGRRRLDLVIATHEHKDHICGFDPALFAPFEIGAIWMNCAMDPDHPQATGARQLHGLAAASMRSLSGEALAALGPELRDLAELFSINNDGAVTALKEGLPAVSRRYAHAGMTNDDLGLKLKGATIRVLGPDNDVDGYYLGKPAANTLRGVAQALDAAGVPPGQPAAMAAADTPPPPFVSAADFRRLKSRMLSNAFAFADLSSRVTNNTSLVLLIEWKGKRLLFVGDAEWDSRFRKDKANAAWNVMWQLQKATLDAPIDFLKIGHHGSENATPWGEGEPLQILDAILPAGRGARAIVSTERGKYKTIPRGALMAELGGRIAGTRRYDRLFAESGLGDEGIRFFADYEKDFFGKPQPQRTDFERMLGGKGYIDVTFT